jgi:hypothetical protein
MRDTRCNKPMWMNSRFAQWEVEGEVWQRVNGTLHEWEQERLARTARGAKAKHTPGSVLSAAGARLAWLASRAVAGVQGVHSWAKTVAAGRV